MNHFTTAIQHPGYNTLPINERARGHTKVFVMTLTDFSRREKSSKRESMQGEKGALCWVICSCMKHFTAKPEHYKCLQIRLYTCVLSNTYMLVSKFRDTAPILGERNILYTVAASGALPGLHLPILTLNVIRKKWKSAVLVVLRNVVPW